MRCYGVIVVVLFCPAISEMLMDIRYPYAYKILEIEIQVFYTQCCLINATKILAIFLFSLCLCNDYRFGNVVFSSSSRGKKNSFFFLLFLNENAQLFDYNHLNGWFNENLKTYNIKN